ncbi:MAG TPA: chromate transporter [Solirubrobacteraceae bacterium]
MQHVDIDVAGLPPWRGTGIEKSSATPCGQDASDLGVTNQQLNVSIVVTRSTPGPGRPLRRQRRLFVAGAWGVAGWGAMITPALSAVGLLRFVGRRPEHPRAASAIQAVVLASAGLLWVDAIPLGRQAITDPVLLVILVLGAGVLATRKVESVWVILGSAIVYLAAASSRSVAGL